MTNKLFSLTVISLFFIAISCSKEKSQEEIDQETILKYIEDNNLDMTAHYSGIYYKITKTGSGGSPIANSDVSVLYKGYLTDGTVFDEATTVISFPLSNLITGWQIAIPMLQKGGKGTFIIPSELGYGSRSTGSIPANSVLIFEITLVDFY